MKLRLSKDYVINTDYCRKEGFRNAIFGYEWASKSGRNFLEELYCFLPHFVQKIASAANGTPQCLQYFFKAEVGGGEGLCGSSALTA